MELLDLMKTRHSIRKYTAEKVSTQDLEKILQAGMLSASGKNTRPWEFIVVREKEVLKEMASARSFGAQMLTGADTAIVVIADTNKTDTWIEDCAVAMANMHLAAHSLGVGSSWIQGRLRETKNGQSTEEFLRALLGFPDNYKLVAMLSLGMPNEEKPASKVEDLPVEKIHWGKY